MLWARKKAAWTAALAVLALGSGTEAMAQTQVVMETDKGEIVIELFDAQAPKSVANFLKYVEAGFYDETIFHRIIAGFVVQGGGYKADGRERRKDINSLDYTPVENEAENGLKNLRGSLSMARTSDPHSATSQFFINLNDNAFLDHPGQDGWGYAVFGKVTSGMDAVDAMAKVPTAAGDKPVEDIAVIKAYVKQ